MVIIDYFVLSHKNVSEDGISDIAHLHATNIHTPNREAAATFYSE